MLRQNDEADVKTGGDEIGKLKEGLQAELEKELRLPDAEFDSEKTLYMLELLKKIEWKEAGNERNSPDDKEPTSEEQTAAFIKRFNEKNGTNFAATRKELESRKRAARMRWMRAAAILVVIVGSFGVMNQVTKASQNQTIFEFLRMKATQFVYQINAGEYPINEDSSTSFIDKFDEQEVLMDDILSNVKFTLYWPRYIPEKLSESTLGYQNINNIDEIFVKYFDVATSDYLYIIIYQSKSQRGFLDLFIGEQWDEKEISLESGERVSLYIGEKCMTAMIPKGNNLYIFSTNTNENELIKVMNSLEEINEEK